jgi:hypothetical protein
MGNIGVRTLGSVYQLHVARHRQAELLAYPVDSRALNRLPVAFDRQCRWPCKLLRQAIADRKAGVAARGEALAVRVYWRVVRATLLELVAVLATVVKGPAV